MQTPRNEDLQRTIQNLKKADGAPAYTIALTEVGQCYAANPYVALMAFAEACEDAKKFGDGTEFVRNHLLETLHNCLPRNGNVAKNARFNAVRALIQAIVTKNDGAVSKKRHGSVILLTHSQDLFLSGDGDFASTDPLFEFLLNKEESPDFRGNAAIALATLTVRDADLPRLISANANMSRIWQRAKADLPKGRITDWNFGVLNGIAQAVKILGEGITPQMIDNYHNSLIHDYDS